MDAGRFAEKLRLHAEPEERVLYPAAILVGEGCEGAPSAKPPVMELLANLAGVLLAGWLLGVEVWVVAIAILAWVVARQEAITPRVLAVAGLLLSASAAAYVVIVVLIGVRLSAGL
jgi:hypothetical protein